MKVAKTSSSPEMKISQKTSKVIPGNEVVLPLKDKSKIKPKTLKTLHGVKHSHKETDYEEDDDDNITSEAKMIKKGKNGTLIMVLRNILLAVIFCG